MKELTTHERMMRILSHQEADRVPITDGPWGTTLARWRREGLPAEGDWAQHLGLDRFAGFRVDTSPQYPTRVIEETDDWVIRSTSWGATLKQWTKHGGVPEFLDFTITGPDTWRAAKARMTPSRDRIPWDVLEKEYPRWRADGAWISAGFWFGFDVTHSWTVGTERVLMALIEDPEWLVEMFNHFLDMDIALYDLVWNEGYQFDEIRWPDDMGYKGHQFFSLNTYRELLKPVHQRAVEWAHAKGIKAELHSCGDVRPLVPELVEIGIDILNPLEVKAGMDPVKLKQEYGDRLSFHGGLNAALYPHPEKLYAQMREVIPVLKRGGGYIAGSDHSVPDSVSLEEFKRFVALAKELGKYG